MTEIRTISGLELREDGRTLQGLVVPSGVDTRIGGYLERFAPGAFADAVASADGCAPTKSETAFCETSNTRSLKPASTRRVAIGRPIMPRPMKAMVAGGVSVVMDLPLK